MGKQTLPGGITQEQLNEWVEKYGKVNENVFRGSVPSLREQDKKLYFYYRKPDKNVVALCVSYMMRQEAFKASDEFRNNCLLFSEAEISGDELHKDEYHFAIGKAIGERFEMVQVELEKI